MVKNLTLSKMAKLVFHLSTEREASELPFEVLTTLLRVFYTSSPFRSERFSSELEAPTTDHLKSLLTAMQLHPPYVHDV